MLSTIKSSLSLWSKIDAKLILSRIPMPYGFWQGVGLFRHGDMDTVGYVLGVFDTYVVRAGLHNADLEGKTLLKIGPGDSIAAAIIAYAHGANAILVDSGSYAKNTLEPYRALCNFLGSRGMRDPDLSQLHTIDEMQCQFERAGFNVEPIESLRRQVLPTLREKIEKVFVTLPDDALNVFGFDVLLRSERTCAA
jgi:hypothetical protein